MQRTDNTYIYNLLISRLRLLSINHRSSGLGIREKFALSDNEISLLLEALHDKLGACVLLNTCNRIEIYVATDKISPIQTKSLIIEIISSIKRLDVSWVNENAEFLYGENVIKHLFAVSAGLESMVLGEGQIIAQVKSAYQRAVSLGHNDDNILNQLFQRALSAGKKSRTNTDISKGAMSVSSVSIECIQNILHLENFAKQEIMIIGTGTMGRLTAELLFSYSRLAVQNLSLVNRTGILPDGFLPDSLAPKLHIYQTSELSKIINKYQIIFVCSSADKYLIEPRDLSDCKDKMIFCDMSCPRNVNPDIIKLGEHIKLIDLDILEKAVSVNINKRAKSSQEAENILEQEREKFIDWCCTSHDLLYSITI